MRTVSLRTFREAVAEFREPVVVQKRTEAGDYVDLGLWWPEGYVPEGKPEDPRDVAARILRPRK
jgi:hypothetical protein